MLKVIHDSNRLAEYSTILQTTDLFKAMPAATAQSLVSASKILLLKKNDTLLLQHDPADWFYFMVSGWVKLYRETQDGDEAVIELLGEGDFVGELSFLEGGRYTSNATAVDKTMVLKMPLSLLKQATCESHTTSLALLKLFADKRQRQSQELEGLKLQNAQQRIGCFLLRQCGGKPGGAHCLTLPYGKSLIATQLGMKGETFSRALSKLKSASNVDVCGGVVHVPNIKDLADFVCVGCSNEYPCKDILLDPRQIA